MPLRATALLVVGLAVAACGKYGPPVRPRPEPAPAAETLSEPGEPRSAAPEAPPEATEEIQP